MSEDEDMEGGYDMLGIDDDSRESRYLEVIVTLLQEMPDQEQHQLAMMLQNAKELLTTMALNKLNSVFSAISRNDINTVQEPVEECKQMLVDLRSYYLYNGMRSQANKMLVMLSEAGMEASDPIVTALMQAKPKLYEPKVISNQNLNQENEPHKDIRINVKVEEPKPEPKEEEDDVQTELPDFTPPKVSKHIKSSEKEPPAKRKSAVKEPEKRSSVVQKRASVAKKPESKATASTEHPKEPEIKETQRTSVIIKHEDFQTKTDLTPPPIEPPSPPQEPVQHTPPKLLPPKQKPPSPPKYIPPLENPPLSPTKEEIVEQPLPPLPHPKKKAKKRRPTIPLPIYSPRHPRERIPLQSLPPVKFPYLVPPSTGSHPFKVYGPYGQHQQRRKVGWAAVDKYSLEPPGDQVELLDLDQIGRVIIKKDLKQFNSYQERMQAVANLMTGLHYNLQGK
ncbi:UNVERIFIED_CONTAM: hypothetical protein HDU68_004197 [Siphonaria sp. JEL0065]|nr:hypothetical protein HDU68_004197 [Siphonaria sp. JEL0065]